MKFRKLSVLIISLIGAYTSNAQNLVQNSGFEAGYTDWTQSGMLLTAISHSGVSAAIGQAGGDDLSQAIATSSGSLYDITFWLRLQSYAFPEPTTLSVTWGGTTEFTLAPTSDFGYTEETIDNVTATSGSTTLGFNLATSGANFLIDDVSVVKVTPASVPDGSWTAALLGLGFGALGFAKRAFFRQP